MTEDLTPRESFKSLSSSTSLRSALETGAGRRRVGDGGGLISAVEGVFVNGLSFLLPVNKCIKDCFYFVLCSRKHDMLNSVHL